MTVATEREYGLFINGRTAEPASGDVRELTEPATGEPLARAAMAGPEDVDRAVEAARAAVAGPWGKTPPNERSRLLHAVADAILNPPKPSPALRRAQKAHQRMVREPG